MEAVPARDHLPRGHGWARVLIAGNHRAHVSAPKRRGMRRRESSSRLSRFAVLLFTPLTLSSCATYHSLPLPVGPDLDKALARVDTGSLRRGVPWVAPRTIDATDGLDMTEVATLAVVNNRDLRAQRRKAGVARAQVFSAGLLPDPQFAASLDYPTDNTPGLSTAYLFDLSYDIQALITRDAGMEAARATESRVDLDVLWQEWQVVQRARSLYVGLVYARRKLALLERMRRLFAQRYARSSSALRSGDVTLGVVGTDLTALLDAESQLGSLRRQRDRDRHDLEALLGLAPEVELHLASVSTPVPMPKATVDRALATIPRRRPDLLALEAGYRSQEAEVRRAILAQFPSLSVGLSRASDTSAVHTAGFSVTLNLPVFTRNRGQIAVQRATREQLRAEFQARLDEALGKADLLWRQQGLIEEQARQIDGSLPALEKMVGEARGAYERHDIDALTYLNMEKTLLQKRLEREDLAQDLWMTRIALDTLLGWPQPDPAAAGTGQRQ